MSVILDGENCWEHYPGGGVDFPAHPLRTLHAHARYSPRAHRRLSCRTQPPQDTLPHLFAGSWISHNFAIWIGHPEDNTGWDAVPSCPRTPRNAQRGMRTAGSRDRSLSAAARPISHSADRLERAWNELYIAEGSDWFWWFGDDHSSSQDALFDYLFRKHLQNVYMLLGDAPPPELARPISRRAPRVHYTQPRAFLEVKLDGRSTFFEWLSAGHYACQNERGTMAQATAGPLRDVYFGFDLNALFIRVDLRRPARSPWPVTNCCASVSVEPASSCDRRVRPVKADGLAPATRRPETERACWLCHRSDRRDRLPFDVLGVTVDEPLQFYVEVVQDGQGLDRAPPRAPSV